MVLNESVLLDMHRIAQLRGISLQRHHVEQVARELDRRGSMSMDDLFDRLRSLGSRMSFAAEKGLRQWLTEIEETRAHRRNLDITRNAVALDAIRDPKKRRLAELYGAYPAQAVSPTRRVEIKLNSREWVL